MLNAAKLKAVPARKVEAPALQEEACEGEPMVEGEEEENLEHDAVEAWVGGLDKNHVCRSFGVAVHFMFMCGFAFGLL